MALHPKGRRRPLPRWRITGNGRLPVFGPYEYDAKSGWLMERSRTVPQGAGRVSRRRRDGSYDLPWGDRNE